MAQPVMSTPVSQFTAAPSPPSSARDPPQLVHSALSYLQQQPWHGAEDFLAASQQSPGYQPGLNSSTPPFARAPWSLYRAIALVTLIAVVAMVLPMRDILAATRIEALQTLPLVETLGRALAVAGACYIARDSVFAC